VIPPEPWPSASGWRGFFDQLSDAVVVFDASARVVLANTAALRLLPCDVGLPVEQFQAALGAAAVRWLRRAATTPRELGLPPIVRLPDGRSIAIAWRRLDARHAAMHLSLEAAAAAAEMAGGAGQSVPRKLPYCSLVWPRTGGVMALVAS